MELESILLLKNKITNGVAMLPLDIAGGPVAIFGNGHVVTNTGGGGSGGSMGSFRYSFIRGMNSIGAPPLSNLYTTITKPKLTKAVVPTQISMAGSPMTQTLWGEPAVLQLGLEQFRADRHPRADAGQRRDPRRRFWWPRQHLRLKPPLSSSAARSAPKKWTAV